MANGQWTTDQDTLTRLAAIGEVLHLADPDQPVTVTKLDFNRARRRPGAPATSSAEHLCEWFGLRWKRLKEIALAPVDAQMRLLSAAAGKADAHDVGKEEAVWALHVVHECLRAERRQARARELAIREQERVALLEGWDRPPETPDPDAPILIDVFAIDRVRAQLAIPSRRRDSRPLRLPTSREIADAFGTLADALKAAGLPYEEGRREHVPGRVGMPLPDAILACVVAYDALPTRSELDVFARANDLSVAVWDGTWGEAVADARRLASERDILVPDAPPPDDQRPDYGQPVEGVDGPVRQRRFPWHVKVAVAVTFLDWIAEDPANRQPTERIWSTWAKEDLDRPSYNAVMLSGGLPKLLAAAIKERRRRDQGIDSDAQPELETLLERALSPTLAAILRHAQEHETFTSADLDWIGVRGSRLLSTLKQLVDIGTLLFVPRSELPGNARNRYSLARPLSARARRLVNETPIPDETARTGTGKQHRWTDQLRNQHATLKTLAAPFTVHDAVAALAVKKANAQRALNQLAGLGAARSEPDPKHRMLPKLWWVLDIDPGPRDNGRRGQRNPWTPRLRDAHRVLQGLDESWTLAQAEQALGFSKRKTQDIVQALVAQGAVRRDRDPADRKAWLHWTQSAPS